MSQPETLKAVGNAPPAFLLAEASANQQTANWRIDGYEQPIAVFTREAGEALAAASKDAMSQGYRLKIFDAFRLQKAVDHFVRWSKDPSDTRMKEYFFDYFGELSHPDYRGIADEQHEIRMILRDIMMAAGFAPLEEEWWHFRLDQEPYPDGYFTFPVNEASIKR